MSAPTLACVLADAMDPMIQAMTNAMGANTRIDWFPASDHCHAFWNVSVHAHGQCFSANDDVSPSLALMKANNDRQAFEEQRARDCETALVVEIAA